MKGAARLATGAGLVVVVVACGDAFQTGAPTGGDAAADGGADATADAPSSGFCASADAQHAFCADFDESTSLASGWDGPPANGGNASMTLDTNTFLSPPRALRVVTSAPFSDAGTYATLTKTLGPARAFFVDLRVRVDQYGGSGGADQAARVLTIAFDNLELQLLAESPALATMREIDGTADAGTQSDHDLPGLGQSKWLHVGIQSTPGLGGLSILYNGAVVYSKGLAQSVHPQGSARITVGYTAPSASGAWNVYFDDVWMDVTAP